MQSFSQQFEYLQWVLRHTSIPGSNFLKQVIESIEEMNQLWRMNQIFNDSGHDTDSAMFNHLQQMFHLTDDKVAEHLNWQSLALKCLNLQDLSSQYDTRFECEDKNQEIIRDLNSAWENLLFSDRNFVKAFKEFVTEKYEYERLDSSKFKDDCPTFDKMLQKQEDVNRIVDEFDQSLINNTSSKELYECEVEQYSGILKALGIEYSVVPDPIDDVPSVAIDAKHAEKQLLQQEMQMKLQQIKSLEEDLRLLTQKLTLLQ